jgi:hypothetical protein
MQHDTSPSLRLTSGPLEDVKHHRVSDSNPPTSNEDGLDFDRCSALHNAIVKHQWQASGKDLATLLPTMTWWESPCFADQLDAMSKHLPESLVRFLQQALHPEGHVARGAILGNMFYLSSGLAGPGNFWTELSEDMDDSDRIALYLTDYEISDPSIDGIVYDLDAHCCVFNSYPYMVFTEDDKTPVWQYLETILTAWIDIIERRKAVVVRGLFGVDPVTGVSSYDIRHPWGWATYTRADVDETIEAWHGLVNAINNRLPQPHTEPLADSRGLYEATDLAAAGIAEGSFAWQFYTQARRPRIRSLGPGNLHLPSTEQLTSTTALFETAWANSLAAKPTWLSECKPGHPLPILLGHSSTKFWSHESRSNTYGSEMISLPWGLYLDVQHDPPEPCPYEDGARLALPALREPTTLRKLDGQPAGHADLYQVGQNPFEPDHSTQLRHLLGIFTTHVENEEWRVDADGVSEPASVFEDTHAQIDHDSDEAENMRFDELYHMYLD